MSGGLGVPLTISRAAVLGSVLPLWHRAWPKRLIDKFPTEESYHKWFLELVGILGDPVAVRKTIAWANDRNIKIGSDPYGYKRAFTRNPLPEHLETLGDLLEFTWGVPDLSVLDPMAGGGSIPFEALRFNFRTYANELNPVASVVLKATLDFPARFGSALAVEIKKWGKVLAQRVRDKLSCFFPKPEGESPIKRPSVKGKTYPVQRKYRFFAEVSPGAVHRPDMPPLYLCRVFSAWCR
jgi:putative DNA methylase